MAVDVMAIDYDKYALVYHCHFDVKQKKLHSNYFFIQTKLMLFGI